MTTNAGTYRKAIREFSEYIQREGYGVRLDSSKNHPKLVVIGEGKQAPVFLSKTGNYNNRRYYEDTMTAIRGAMKRLPKPTVKTMDYKAVMSKFDGELVAAGYETIHHVDPEKPRLMIRCPGTDRFATVSFSPTVDYDSGGLLKIKRVELTTALKTIPIPEIAMHPATSAEQNPVINGHHEANLTGPNSPNLEEQISYPLRIFLKGSTLGISVELTALDKFPAPNAKLMLSANKSLIICFSHSGVEPSAAPGGGKLTKCFYFKRGSVPDFKWADRLEPKLPTIFARRKGDSLVTVDPLPPALLGLAPAAIKAGSTVEEGRAAVRRINEWLKKAYDSGMIPTVNFDGKHTIELEVEERIVRKVKL